MRKLRVALGITLVVAALYACSQSKQESNTPYVPTSWSSPIPKLEMTCGDKECL